MLLHIDAAVVGEGDALVAKQVFHDVRAAEVPPSRERPVAVDDAVRRQPRPFAGLHGPADGARRALRAQVFGDVAVGGHLAEGDLRHDVPDALEEILLIYPLLVCHLRMIPMCSSDAA